jgi:hypothetical protein
MAKVRYIYNNETCKYEPVVISPRVAGRKLLVFLGISLLIGMAGLIYFNYRFPLIDETLQAERNQKLKTEWKVLYSSLSVLPIN